MRKAAKNRRQDLQKTKQFRNFRILLIISIIGYFDRAVRVITMHLHHAVVGY